MALTGYNGILGYRTDQSYETRPDDLDANKVEWLDAHPDFSLAKEREGAKKVADAMKAEGWLLQVTPGASECRADRTGNTSDRYTEIQR